MIVLQLAVLGLIAWAVVWGLRAQWRDERAAADLASIQRRERVRDVLRGAG